ncbi:hypothetical protein MSG28_003620 [Choristoneura fumiferana]|uniref:Uncharacterized protein n=1 Tax=Choristoneura fumiferana TaxID=7141 RepID=A0ACC0KFH2_CHOFU|nr:hypothetical protein MSG28_003620 [Choristoneura fumiferana]
MWNKIYTSVKYSLITVNFLFLITGIIILSVGSSVQSAYNGYHTFLSDRFFSLPAFCIATGVIIFLIAFFGFYGAYSENYYLIMTFAGAMVLMFVFQLSACIAGYALKGQAVALFTCCGVLNASDWLQHLNTHEDSRLPMSCCSHVFGTVGQAICNTTVSHNTGCAIAFGSWVQSHVATIGAAGVFLVLAQITSALIISVGTTIYAIYHDVSFFLDQHFFSPATLVIVIGVLMLFVSFYTDWRYIDPPTGVSGITAIPDITVPNSCCAEAHYSVVENATVAECTKLYANGCLPRLIYLVYQSAGLLGAGALTIAFIQLIGIVFSFSLASSIRKAKSERERRRLEIQERVINAHTSLNPNEEKIKPIVYVPFYGQTQTAA